MSRHPKLTAKQERIVRQLVDMVDEVLSQFPPEEQERRLQAAERIAFGSTKAAGGAAPRAKRRAQLRSAASPRRGRAAR